MTSLRTSTLTSRERVHAAVKGLSVDRIPVMYWLNPHMACKMIATDWPTRHGWDGFWAQMLWKWFPKGTDYQGGDLRHALPLLMSGFASGEYCLELGGDIVIAPSTAKVIQKTYREDGRLRVLDLFGSIRGVGGIYAEVVTPAIRSVSDLKTFRFPDPSKESDYDGIRKFRAAHPEVSLMGETFGVQDLFCTQLWKMDEAMLAYYDHPEEVKDYQRRFSDWAVETAVHSAKAGADMVLIYDDYGYTGRTLFSMPMWEEFTFPHLRRLVDAIHESGALAMLHSCGYQMPFLEYYVQAGVDILQPFQPKAGNDFAEALARVGSQLAFATGIDIQLGELMSPQELREDILKFYRLGKQTGRHILATTHNLQFTMPQENVREILRTVREIQTGQAG
jgi:uroporphyrinogen-III decarboxylase